MEVLESKIYLLTDLVEKLEEFGFVEVAHILEEVLWEQSESK